MTEWQIFVVDLSSVLVVIAAAWFLSGMIDHDQ